jgi:prophage regulatory protein
MKHRILRLPEVKTSTGLSRSTIYLRMAEGTFPRQIPLGRRTVGWLEGEVQEWLDRQIQLARSSEPHPKTNITNHEQFSGKTSCD